jgi:peptide subunit release factor 1 (eRF1)
MFNIHKNVVEFECPTCKFPNQVSMREARFGLTVPCRGCKVNIRMVPVDGGVRKAKRIVDNFLNELPETININIKL